MKKIFYLPILLVLLIKITACAGYKPIFNSPNLEFKIADYSVSGDTKLANQIYSKLYNLTQTNQQSSSAKNLYVLINVQKEKKPTAKSSDGKILGYRINLSTTITIEDIMTGNEILNESFALSTTYKVQSQFSETIKLENQSTENLINNTYENLLLKLSENI